MQKKMSSTSEIGEETEKALARAGKPLPEVKKVVKPESDYPYDGGLPDKDLLRVDEVAAYFNVSASTVYLWIDHGILASEKYNRMLRVPRESVVKCRMKHRISAI